MALLAMGFELGFLLASRQTDEANQLVSQATEKVLALTQEKQLLEQRLQGAADGSPVAERRPGEVWRHNNIYYGMLHQGGWITFNDELKVELLAVQAGQAELNLSGTGQQMRASLQPGEKIKLTNGWQLVLNGLGPEWVVLGLQPE